MTLVFRIFTLFFLNAPATTSIYTLSLHDALPISHRTIYQRRQERQSGGARLGRLRKALGLVGRSRRHRDRKSTRLNSSHTVISYAVFCLKKKKKKKKT